MRTWSVVIAAIVVAAVAAWGATKMEFGRPENPLSGLLSTSAAIPGEPKAVLEGSELFEFGKMNVQETMSHLFLLKNIGDAPLVLTKGNTTCKCTVSEVDEKPVAPGETRKVKLEWHPPAASDEFEQSAEIRTNDRTRQTIRFVVRGRVLEALKLDPPVLALSEISSHEPRRFDVRLWSFQNQPIEISTAEFSEEATANLFSVEMRPLTAAEVAMQADAKSGVALQIDLKAGLPAGSFQQKLVLKHNYAEISPLELPISGKAVGDITLIGPAYHADHDYVELGNVDRASGSSTKVFLVVKGPHRNDIQFQVTGIDPSSSLRAEIGTPMNTGGNSIIWPVTFEIPPNAEPVSRLGNELGRLGRVTLSTADPHSPTIVIKVRLAVVAE